MKLLIEKFCLVKHFPDFPIWAGIKIENVGQPNILVPLISKEL